MKNAKKSTLTHLKQTCVLRVCFVFMIATLVVLTLVKSDENITKRKNTGLSDVCEANMQE